MQRSLRALCLQGGGGSCKPSCIQAGASERNSPGKWSVNGQHLKLLRRRPLCHPCLFSWYIDGGKWSEVQETQTPISHTGGTTLTRAHVLGSRDRSRMPLSAAKMKKTKKQQQKRIKKKKDATEPSCRHKRRFWDSLDYPPRGH